MKIGKAKYGFTQKKYWKLKDGESVFRILPPLGDLADSGRWSMYYKVHYGYKNTKDKMRVFQSSLIKNGKTKMVEVPDAALERIEKLKVELEKAKDAKNGPLVEKLLKLVGPKGQYNLDNNHYVNAMDQQGNIGVLKLRHRAKLALDATIKRLREAGTDPLSADNGRFFVFRRSGNALDTSFQVDILQETLKIEGVGEVKRDVVQKLDDATISRLSEEAVELDKLFKKLSAEQIERIVKEGATAVDEIFDMKEDNNSGSDEGQDEPDSDDETPAQSASPTAAPATYYEAPKTETKATETVTPQTEKVAPKVEVVSSPTQTTTKVISDMSDADFLKSLGLS